MTLALNYLIAFLLLVTIIYCWRLNRKIVAIHKSKKEMMALLKCFDNAIIRAEEGINSLKHAGVNAGKALQEDVDKARFLVEDLNFMIERAAKAADRLDENINVSRKMHMTAPRDNKSAASSPRPSFKSAPSYFNGTPAQQAKKTEQAQKKPSSKRSSIEVLLEKLAGKQELSEKRPAKEHRIPQRTPEELGAIPTKMPQKRMTEEDILHLLRNN